MIVFDIETVPNETAIQSDSWKTFKEKHADATDHSAGLHPAFGQVACICAWDRAENKKLKICIDNEERVLNEFSIFVGDKMQTLVGHNIKGFDIPFLANRFIANAMQVPRCLKVAGLKPWEVPHKDTMELLKFGGGRPLSLDAACHMMGIKSPKQEIDGSNVWDQFKVKSFDKILEYCSGDVAATWSVYQTISALAL